MKKYSVRKDIPQDVHENLKAYPELVRSLLFYRGITDAQSADRFLNPDYDRDIHDPFLILGMEKAVDRILYAIGKNEKIVIYGDYDCDGIPGSVVLHDFFKKIGYEHFSNYIPHRYLEGYGFNSRAVEQFASDGVKLIITVDVGITDVESVECANGFGIDVIITDHHLPVIDQATGKQIIPNAYAVINSKQDDDPYPYDMLCGAGTAFKLVQGLLKKGREEWGVHEGWEKWLLDMAGLSTIADMVPLTGENRTLAHFGLKVLRKSPRAGLLHLLRKSRVVQHSITEDDVGFMIAPRINAASRMAEPIEAFHLLATVDETQGGALADRLHRLNDQRKGMVAAMVKEARKKMRDREVRDVIVLGNPLWMPGLLGIAANTLMEEFHRPVFVWGRNGSETIKGSCRSDGTVNIVELMTSAPPKTFLDFGGHDAAGGFSVSHEHIHTLEDMLIGALDNVERREDADATAEVDSVLSLDDVSWDMYRHIEQLAPFGVENPKPVFLFKDIKVHTIARFGKDRGHLRLVFRNSEGEKVEAISFFHKEKNGETALGEGQRISLVANIEKTVFRGAAELRLRTVDYWS